MPNRTKSKKTRMAPPPPAVQPGAQQAKTKAPGLSRNARRRRNKKTSTNRPYTSVINGAPSISVSSNNAGGRDTGRDTTRLNAANMSNVTAAGTAFLKCAFAPPDFQSSNVAGFPDGYEGLSLVKKHRYNASLNVGPGADYYYILAPVPGIAFFSAGMAAGTAIPATEVFVATPYSDLSTLFPSYTTAADLINAFRFVSNHFEIVNCTNEMTWSGSIQAWKTNLKMTQKQGTAAGDIWTVTGLNAVNYSSNLDQYLGAFKQGVYTGAYAKAGSYSFTPILENISALPGTIDPQDFCSLSGSVAGNPIVGLDNNFETVIIKISGLTATNSMFIRTWACVEYQVVAGSALYEYQTISQCDPAALALYKKIILDLPVGVSYLDNPDFWRRVLQTIRTISGGLRMIPGPYGMIAGGVNEIANGISSLTM